MMKKNRLMDMNDNIEAAIEALETIKPVEASSYLKARILARIKHREKQFLSPAWSMAIAATFLALVALNIIVLREDRNEISTIANSVNLIPNHQLYHE
jgi:predicted deacetylase